MQANRSSRFTFASWIGSLIISQRELTEVGVDLGINAEEITLGRLDAMLFGGELRAAGTHLSKWAQ